MIKVLLPDEAVDIRYIVGMSSVLILTTVFVLFKETLNSTYLRPLSSLFFLMQRLDKFGYEPRCNYNPCINVNWISQYFLCICYLSCTCLDLQYYYCLFVVTLLKQVLVVSRVMAAWQPIGISIGIYDMCHRYCLIRMLSYLLFHIKLSC